MNLHSVVSILVASWVSIDAVSINHNDVQPFAQPEPVTVSEKAGVMFKPKLYIFEGCVPFPAVNSAGEITGGLKGTAAAKDCEETRLGSQVYGRSGWYNDKWAIMYAWYFPKGFWTDFPSRRHDWANAVVWIDNPDLPKPTMLGLSTSRGDTKYNKHSDPEDFMIENGATLKLRHQLRSFAGRPYLVQTDKVGDFQDLIMWDQMTEELRAALNTADFGDAKVPFNDDNFEKRLGEGWPF